MNDAEFIGVYRIAGIVDELGTVGRYRVRLFDRTSARVICEVWSAADGSYSFDKIADKAYFVVAFDHGDLPLNASIQDRPTLTRMDGTPLPVPLVFTDGQVVSGNVLKGDGTAADQVVFRDWVTKQWLATITPDASGDWSITLPYGQYDVTYLATGCAPICHGPYTIEAA